MKTFKSNNKLNLFISTVLLGLAACSPKTQNVNSVDGRTGVIDGTPVEENEALSKSTVYLETWYLDEKGEVLGAASCTGTLMANNLVVTAAHCVPSQNKKNFRMIVYFKRDLEALKAEDMRLVRNFIAHPYYIPKDEPEETTTSAESTGAAQNEDQQQQRPAQEGNYDIALVSFEGETPAGFMPAQLLKQNRLLAQNTGVTVSGYGLIKSEGKIKERTTVLRKGPAIFLGFMNPYEAVLDQSQNKTGGGACSGDSGGPATVTIDNVEYVWGVASRVGNMDDESKPCNGMSVYTSIASHEKFIGLATRFLLEDLNAPRSPAPAAPQAANVAN